MICTLLQNEIGLKEWASSLRTAHEMSLELLKNMARKAGKIYGAGADGVAGGGGGGGNAGQKLPILARNGN